MRNPLCGVYSDDGTRSSRAQSSSLQNKVMTTRDGSSSATETPIAQTGVYMTNGLRMGILPPALRSLCSQPTLVTSTSSAHRTSACKQPIGELVVCIRPKQNTTHHRTAFGKPKQGNYHHHLSFSFFSLFLASSVYS